MGTSPEFDLPSPAAGEMTIGGFLDQVTARHRPREAIVFHDPREPGARVAWRYQDLRAHSRAAAKALIAAGAGKGARVGILMGNRPEFVAAFFGAASIGAVVVCLSTFSTREELQHLLVHGDVALLLTQGTVAGKPLLQRLLGICPEAADAEPGRIASPRQPFLRRVVALQPGAGAGQVQDWDAFVAAGAGVDDALLDACMSHVSPSDDALVIYTSGTTAEPKGILHNHRTAVLQYRRNARAYGRTQQTRIWSPFPLFWAAGTATILGSTLAAGGCWVAQEVFEPAGALELLAQEKVTEAYGFPAHTAALADRPEWLSTDLSSLACVSGNYEFAAHPRTSPDPHWHMLSAYGLSETYTLAASHTADTPKEVQALSVGKPAPGVEIRIVDAAARELPVGHEGEICLRGIILMERYLKMTRDECFDPDGFLHTGDLGFLDADGFLHWTGRLKSMIKTGGANVSPSEIEAVAARFGPLKLCRALGIPDRRLGEMVVLCAVVAEGARVTEAEVTAYLRERLAPYKTPRAVFFFRAEDYPLTASGKVKEAELRALVVERLAAQPANAAGR